MSDIEEESAQDEVWKDHQRLQKLQQEKAHLLKSISSWEELYQSVEDLGVLLDMSVEEKDESQLLQVKNDLKTLEEKMEALEIYLLLGEKTDGNNAYISIHAGAGGTESCDWAQMLFRMYTRYLEKNGLSFEVLSVSEGEEAGMKSVTFLAKGSYAYGYLKTETGVHRLVRVSPFDANARRHTSFASVSVWPEVDDEIHITIEPEDLRIDTYRASGAGGQHVNRTDSAVRITHLPTKIVVQCQSERSQHSNKDKAFKMLKSALYEKEQEKRKKEQEKMRGEQKENKWGSQIRSYVLYPYRMVKDHRTGYESSQSDGVLDGDIQEFIKAFLKFSRRKG